METMMRLILDGLYCLVALCAGGFFVAMIYTDIKKDQRDEEMARHRMNGKKSTTASRWNPSGNK